MLKRIAALALSAALLTGSALAVTPEEAFPAVHTYPGFIDVAEGAWYANAARVCCEVGLMQGTGQAFAPDQVLTVGEVAAIAARMNQAVTGEAIPEANPGQPAVQILRPAVAARIDAGKPAVLEFNHFIL